jgi:hypothetical protein
MKRILERCLVACAFALAITGPASMSQAQSDLPLLPEDTPDDVFALGLGPWDGHWVIRSSNRGDVSVTTYFCSEEVASICIGQLYTRVEPGQCEVGCTGTECTGPCEGTGDDDQSSYHQGCTTDADCPITDSHSTCDDAKAEAETAADKACKDKGGEKCVCYSQAHITSKSGKCKRGALGRYCKYRCAATSKGTCGADWVAAVPAPGGTTSGSVAEH